MTGITVEQLEEKREVLEHFCTVYQKQSSCSFRRTSNKVQNSYEKLLNNLSSELMFYSCMSIRLGTYIDETTEDGLDMIRAANKYVIDNWQSLVKLAKKNNLEDMDNLLDQYSRISLRPDILTIWKGAGSMLNLEQTKRTV